MGSSTPTFYCHSSIPDDKNIKPVLSHCTEHCASLRKQTAIHANTADIWHGDKHCGLFSPWGRSEGTCFQTKRSTFSHWCFWTPLENEMLLLVSQKTKEETRKAAEFLKGKPSSLLFKDFPAKWSWSTLNAQEGNHNLDALTVVSNSPYISLKDPKSWCVLMKKHLLFWQKNSKDYHSTFSICSCSGKFQCIEAPPANTYLI